MSGTPKPSVVEARHVPPFRPSGVAKEEAWVAFKHMANGFSPTGGAAVAVFPVALSCPPPLDRGRAQIGTATSEWW